MPLQPPGTRWASLNLGEDQPGDLRIGSPAELTPADMTPPIEAKIDEIVTRGEFATWRAARTVGDHDLNTFLPGADPMEPASDALQSGVSV